MAVMLAKAVETFFGDYNKLPLPSGPAPPGGDRDTDSSPSHDFIAVLMGKEEANPGNQNPRQTDYLEGMKQARSKPGGDYPWQNGRISDAAIGAYSIVDYNGKPYRIRLDTNNDNFLTNPNPDRVGMQSRVLVWSAGKDGDWTTWDDNLISWE